MRIEYPKVYSLIDAPEAALSLIERLVQSCRDPSVKSIYLDQHDCERIDYGAEALSGAIVQLALEQPGNTTREIGGRTAADRAAAAVAIATGLPHILGVEDLPDLPEFRRFDLVRGDADAAPHAHSSMRDRVTTELVQYINECLHDHAFGLTADGLKYLSRLIGEVIGNAEDHSASKYWWAGAYLRQPNGQDYGDLHLTIFNLGRSMSETLQDLPPGSMLRGRIEELVRKHRKLWHGGWKLDTLWTVYALQEGVSRKNTGADRVGNQGRGTADLIDFFQQLGEVHNGVKPRMCLISGRTHILFDEERFPMRRVPTAQGTTRLIAFNPENSLEKPPSRDVVRRLRHRFPGTLLSLRFYLDPKHLTHLSARPQWHN